MKNRVGKSYKTSAVQAFISGNRSESIEFDGQTNEQSKKTKTKSVCVWRSSCNAEVSPTWICV